ncbi:MAG: hypothetical protein DRP95_02190 [Candidatus Latescibacterota bacterium]|nr:MAG: hypothetical protein DRP95_02190 [Candidatus Latescibacterota bacterium]
MQEMLRDFMETTQFMLGLYAWRREYRELVEDMAPFYEELIRVVAESPAEVVLYGGNYDDMITYPRSSGSTYSPGYRKRQRSSICGDLRGVPEG